jgi:regulator of replication initiation timing
MSMTPTERKLSDSRKEVKELTKDNAELKLQVQFLTDRLDQRTDRVFNLQTKLLNTSVDQFIKLKESLSNNITKGNI